MLSKEKLIYHRFSDEDLLRILGQLSASMLNEGFSDDFVVPVIKNKKRELLTKFRNHNNSHGRFDKQRNRRNRNGVSETNKLLRNFSEEHLD